HAIVVKEAAILFESGAYKNCDKIITVVVPENTRIQRVVQRDNATEEMVKSRIKNQWSDEQRMALSDYIVINENLEEAKNQVNVIINELQNV
ncbi:MAG: dephospho-CoA kinase, partial [Flavobacterium sp.]|nr:dephospho-CoA kinase [Flavobacterium sp.]